MMKTTMQTTLKVMRKKETGIPKETVALFEGIIEEIIQKYGVPGKGTPGLGMEPEWDNEFCKALDEYLTREQRFRVYEQAGGCMDARHDKERDAFAHEHVHMTFAERFEQFKKVFGRKAVLNSDNTITVTFSCKHGYYKHAREGKYLSPPPSVESYFERCAGGRLYEYQKALGIKLRIKSVDVSPLSEDILNPVVFRFEVV